MAAGRKARLGGDDLARAKQAFLQGASPHVVAAQLKITLDEARRIQAQVADEAKPEYVHGRMLQRNMLRERVPLAVQTLVEAHTGKRQVGGQLEDVYHGKTPEETKLKIAIMTARVAAASKLLSVAGKYISEDLFSLLLEKPDPSLLQKDLFTFASQIDDTGGAELRIIAEGGGRKKPKAHAPAPTDGNAALVIDVTPAPFDAPGDDE